PQPHNGLHNRITIYGCIIVFSPLRVFATSGGVSFVTMASRRTCDPLVDLGHLKPRGNSMADLDTRLAARPLYLQVRDVLVQRIVVGHWKPGAPLPNETHLAQQLGISSGTVRKALDLMEVERIVTRRQGRGTFVNDYAS